MSGEDPTRLSLPVTGVKDAEAAEDDGLGRRPGGSDTPAVLVVVLLVASLALLGVLLTIASTRGIGPFADPTPTPVPGEPVAATVAAARASSALPSTGDVTYEPDNVTDGDATTAWNEAAPGPGQGEWIELDLAEPAPVVHLLVWNGYQKEGQYDENARVRSLQIDLGERTLAAELLDTRGPQAVALPEPVVADRIRLTIVDVYEGTRYADAALSRVEVYVEP